jgi:transposase
MSEEQRFVGLDVHKAQVTVAIVNREQEVLLQRCKIASYQFQQWAQRHLEATDQVVLEATNDAWLLWIFYARGSRG